MIGLFKIFDAQGFWTNIYADLSIRLANFLMKYLKSTRKKKKSKSNRDQELNKTSITVTVPVNGPQWDVIVVARTRSESAAPQVTTR